MTSWQAWLDLGGYAAFVWPSYLLAFLLLGGLLLLSWHQARRQESKLASRERSLDEGKGG